MPFCEESTQFVYSAGSVLVGLIALVAGAGCFMGISFERPEQFLDAHRWVQAFNDCLHSF
jgi:hypothetical protein